jgi:hypothetical protein
MMGQKKMYAKKATGSVRGIILSKALHQVVMG